MCIDIDECNRGTHNCDLTVGTCQNLISTFVCNCPISHYMVDALSSDSGKNDCILIDCTDTQTEI